ncbi:DUF2125 domain-containing protein [Asticcacaulis solisilvae]|uniref:DUF2125 domain-containing protein n=1 Tax=Asticcacaulis solisilvae TaxID=1217274 RepID=UPI003FD8053C
MTEIEVPKRRHIGVFVPTAVVVVLIVLWTAWWFIAAHRVEAAFHTQADALTKQGYRVSTAPYTVKGYPYRLAVELRDVNIVAPTGRGFSAPELDVEANAYNPDKWVLVAGKGLTLYRGHDKAGADLGTLALSGKVLRASVSHLGQAVPDIRLQGMEVTATPSDPTHPFVFDTATLAEAYLRPNAKDADSADWLVRWTGARGRAPGFTGKVSPNAPLDLHIEGTIGHVSAFKGVNFADGLTAWKAGGIASNLIVELKRPDTTLRLTSDGLSADADNHVQGKVKVELTGAAGPIDMLSQAGVLSGDTVDAAEPLLDLAMGANNGPARLTIDFKKGKAYIGPIKVANAPTLP